MAEKRRLFIYDRKEVGVLTLLGIGVALFAFTLGVHLGKQVVPKSEMQITRTEEKSADPLEPAPVAPPNRTEVADEVRNVPQAVDAALDEALRDEVAQTGIQVDKVKPLKLPEETKPRVRRAAVEPRSSAPAPSRAELSRETRYVLQVGSFPSLREAEPHLSRLNEKGLRAEIREVDLRGKGKWFRVVLGNYSSIAEAEKAGNTFRDEKRIGDFVVVNAGAGASTGKN